MDPLVHRQGINDLDWTEFTKESFLYISADHKKHLDSVAALTPGDFHAQWKICPLFVSMWLCLFSRSTVSTTERRHILASPALFLAAVEQLTSELSGPPSPARVMARALELKNLGPNCSPVNPEP